MTPDEIATRLRARAERHDGQPRWWVESATDEPEAAIAAAARELGLVMTRRMYQLRRELPLERDLVASIPTIPIRSFRPGQDDGPWLAVNNAAFRWHPDQGGWTETQLEQRMAEPWFDPAGFLITQSDGHIAGFCWTKVHPTDPPIGEIYVIGADPTHQGHGLGAALTVAGLEWLWSHRHTPVAMLYVESTNSGALRLYDRLGFTRDHTDICFELRSNNSAEQAR